MKDAVTLWHDRATAFTAGSAVALFGLIMCAILSAPAGVAFFAVVGSACVMGAMYSEARLARARRGRRSR